MIENRTKKIIDYIQNKNIKSMHSILKKTDLFECSKVTIRRELHKLETMGYIKLKYGTIDLLTYEKFMDGKSYEPFNYDKNFEIISKEAVELIIENDSVFVTSGKTMHYFVKNINKSISLLLTNSIEIALAASNNVFIKKVILFGGIINKEKRSTYGPMLETHIDEIFINKLFMSCDHLDRDGVFCDDIHESFIIKKMMNNATKKYLLVDSTKTNSKGTIKVCSKDVFEKIILDND